MIPTDELADRLHGVSMRLLRLVRETDGEAGLSTARLSALSTLVFSGPLSVGELAAAEDSTAPAMSRVVTALERAGHVRRAPDGSEAGRARVTATQAGIGAWTEARRERVERLAGVLGELDDLSRETVAEAAALLEEALDRSDRQETAR